MSSHNVNVHNVLVRLPLALNIPAPTVVVIDHTESAGATSRADALTAVQAMCPRIIILDDSDRSEYQESMRSVNNYEAHRYRGFRSYPLQVTETTVFTSTCM